ncbi:AI-2E family transporter [Mycobacterium sp. MYCO198283]|uniref:AI-2E family transporter n=1 Tax=Mycobacterium sp. MYCO198283 TaxID=2883505 RepID=UPI001E4424EA|nr:AI-2E family transporter [Mycobacterium sp. MYCO198283]MCG5431999.1 AI-2E family transporter [Mycobacterium sp. MYCO198283]
MPSGAAGASLDNDEFVHPLVRKGAAWSWRLLVLLAAGLAVLWVVRHLWVIFVPVALALLLSALLVPGVDWLDRRGVPRGGAVFLLLLTGLALVGGILSFVVSQFIAGTPDLVAQVTRSIESTKTWLINGPLKLDEASIQNATRNAVDTLQNNQSRLTSGALSTAATITEIVTGAFLLLFTLIFFLYGGRNIWQWVTQIFPVTVRERVREAGAAGFHSLVGYIRATFLVALVDAIGIGTGLAVMGVPLALPLASLVFLGAFVPLVGAVVSGFLAVVVALLAKGWITALIILGVVIAVQQLEAHVLQPLVMGRAVSIHPLGVVLAISAGGVLSGVLGALLAVPAVAFLNSAIRKLLEPHEDPVPAGQPVGITAEADEPPDHGQGKPENAALGAAVGTDAAGDRT